MRPYSRRIEEMIGRIVAEYPALDAFIHSLDSDVYLVGGYIRDSLIGKESRDIDMIVDAPASWIEEQLNKQRISFKRNHFGGFKFDIGKEIDLWSLEDNWAFKNGFVPALHQDLLHYIALGCFYNYDSLVVNYKTQDFNLSNYVSFLRTNTLRIVFDSNEYYWENPTSIANVCRALWISGQTGAQLSDQVQSYMNSVLGEFMDGSDDYLSILSSKLDEYPKYRGVVDYTDIIRFYQEYQRQKDNLLSFYDYKPMFKQLEFDF